MASIVRMIARMSAVAVSATLYAPFAVPATPAFTQKCTTAVRAPEVEIGFLASSSAESRILGAIANPESDPDLYEALWRPDKTSRGIHISGYWYAFLRYANKLLDTEEVAAKIAVDPALPATPIYAGGRPSCLVGVVPGGGELTVVEWYNRDLDHYFLSSDYLETQAIEAGRAGPGWERTGQTFVATYPECYYGGTAVSRFYNRVANTHFFTNDPVECGEVYRSDPGWVAEGVPFAANAPTNGQCSYGHSVWRLYNGRWRENDSNHRFVTSLAIRDQMVAKGWISEGVAFCVRAVGPGS